MERFDKTSDNNRKYKQAIDNHEEQLPSLETIARTLLDVRSIEKLTIQDKRDALHVLIKVSIVELCRFTATYIYYKTQRPVCGVLEGDQLDKAVQVTVSGQYACIHVCMLACVYAYYVATHLYLYFNSIKKTFIVHKWVTHDQAYIKCTVVN